MTKAPYVKLTFATSDGRTLGLVVARFDEFQRRLRMSLPANAGAWDYAPLIDVVFHESGFDTPRFAGKTAAQWSADLLRRRSPDAPKFRRWYEAVLEVVSGVLARRPRRPDNIFSSAVAVPPLASSLPDAIGQTGLHRASAAQWRATLRALTRCGISAQELDASGVLVRLGRLAPEATVPLDQVLSMIDLSSVRPRMATECGFAYHPKAGWDEVCKQVAPSSYARHGLKDGGFGHSWYVIRYRHRSLGWSIIRCHYRDLLTQAQDWWWVVDQRGQPLHGVVPPFPSALDAMAFAERVMGERLAAWGQEHTVSRWEFTSLPGGTAYQEILLQLDDWVPSYQCPHFRSRNVLAHIRCSVHQAPDGRRVLYLHEVQSDWHAALHRHRHRQSDANAARASPPATAPYGREWPRMAMKIMLWWAQQLGLDGLAWSTAQLQATLWRNPPTSVYLHALPQAAAAMAKTLGAPLDRTRLSVRTSSRVVHQSQRGWVVRSREQRTLTKPFQTRLQAERFADLTGQFIDVEVPVLWLSAMPAIKAIPLYGLASRAFWFEARDEAGQRPGNSDGGLHAPVQAREPALNGWASDPSTPSNVR